MKKLIILMAGCILLFTEKVQCQLSTSLEEYYKLDETNGQAVNSVNPGVNNSSNVDATQGASGKLGTSYQFNGTNQEITFADHANWTVNTTDNLSVSMWINFTGDITHTWATLWGHQNGPQLYLTFKSAGNYTIGWWTGGSNGTESNTLSFSTNTWYHIVFVKNGSSIAFYRNGSVAGAATVTGYNVNPIALYIGGDTYSTPQAFKGKIDEVGIWKRALTSTEVSDLYNNGNGLDYPFELLSQNVTFGYDLSGNRTSLGIIEMDMKSTAGISNDSGPKEIFSDQIRDHAILIYPNPVRDQLLIEIGGQTEREPSVISLFDVNGRLIKMIETKTEVTPLSFTNLSRGIYIMIIRCGNDASEWKINRE